MTEKFSEINETSLRTTLIHFYNKVREDDLIGPIFIEKIGTTDEDWAPHIDRVVNFWRSVLLGEKTYDGGFMMKHMSLPGLEMKHFRRWVELFIPTVEQHFDIHQSLEITIKAQTLMRNLHNQYGRFQVRQAQKGAGVIIQ